MLTLWDDGMQAGYFLRLAGMVKVATDRRGGYGGPPLLFIISGVGMWEAALPM